MYVVHALDKFPSFILHWLCTYRCINACGCAHMLCVGGGHLQRLCQHARRAHVCVCVAGAVALPARAYFAGFLRVYIVVVGC